MDERWANEDNTVVTGATSEHSYSGNNDNPLQPFAPAPGQTLGRMAIRRCSWLCWLCSAFLISFMALVSAPLMVALPHALGQFGFHDWVGIGCEIDCQVNLIN